MTYYTRSITLMLLLYYNIRSEQSSKHEPNNLLSKGSPTRSVINDIHD
jgi:hypothetical protein